MRSSRHQVGRPKVSPSSFACRLDGLRVRLEFPPFDHSASQHPAGLLDALRHTGLSRLPHAHRRSLLAAALAQAERLSAGGQLLLLRLVGLAVPQPHRHLDGRRLSSAPHVIARSERDPCAAQGRAGGLGRDQPGVPRLLQVLQLLRRTRSSGCCQRLGPTGDRDAALIEVLLPPGISFYTFQASPTSSTCTRGARSRPTRSSTTRCSSLCSRI